VATAVGAVGLACRPGAEARAQQSAAPERADGKPLSEVELLRKKVELLEYNLQLVLEKSAAQERELRALRAASAGPRKPGSSPTVPPPNDGAAPRPTPLAPAQPVPEGLPRATPPSPAALPPAPELPPAPNPAEPAVAPAPEVLPARPVPLTPTAPPPAAPDGRTAPAQVDDVIPPPVERVPSLEPQPTPPDREPRLAGPGLEAEKRRPMALEGAVREVEAALQACREAPDATARRRAAAALQQAAAQLEKHVQAGAEGQPR
jgi:hypothetical protein